MPNCIKIALITHIASNRFDIVVDTVLNPFLLFKIEFLVFLMMLYH